MKELFLLGGINLRDINSADLKPLLIVKYLRQFLASLHRRMDTLKEQPY